MFAADLGFGVCAKQSTRTEKATRITATTSQQPANNQPTVKVGLEPGMRMLCMTLSCCSSCHSIYMNPAAQVLDMLYIHTKSQRTTNNQQPTNNQQHDEHDEHERDQDQDQYPNLLRLPLHITVRWETEICVGSVHQVYKAPF